MKRGLKSQAHKDEMAARAERRAARSESTVAFAPRIFKRSPTTTDVVKVKAAKDKRDRRALRNLTARADRAYHG